MDPRKGKFRSFLLAAMRHFLANEWDRARTLKRGGRVTFLSLDAEGGAALPAEQLDRRSPEKIYERRWAMALLDRRWDGLREESAACRPGGTVRGLRLRWRAKDRHVR